MRFAVSIGGLDPTGGAGILADQIAFASHGLAFASAVTCHVPQTADRVTEVQAVSAHVFQEELRALDSLPEIETIKISAISDESLFDPIVSFLVSHKDVPCVIDPILAASDGTEFLPQELWSRYLQTIAPHATLLTPNRREVLQLSGLDDRYTMDDVAAWFRDTGIPAMLVKSAEVDDETVTDILISQQSKDVVRLEQERLSFSMPHGSGCHLAASIAAHLGHGFGLYDSIQRAKNWFTQAAESSATLPSGRRVFMLFPEEELDQ